MRYFCAPVLAVLALSACGGEASVDADVDGDGTVTSEEMREAVSEAGGALKPEPGQYSVTTKLTKIEAPGAPEMMRNMMGAAMDNTTQYCLTQEMVDQWCREIRPDQADSIWCLDKPAKRFGFKTDATPGPSDREEPELAARYTDTALGPGRVTCFYSPNPDETDRQGASCSLSFIIADGVSVAFGARREQIASGDSVLIETIELVPEYWANLTANR